MSSVGGKSVLFISYDGMTDPLGRSQVLPYLTGLSALGHRIEILSCEKPDRPQPDHAAVAALCEGAGIEWSPIRYRAGPPVLGPLLNARALKRAAFAIHRQRRYEVAHCRSYIPAIVGLGLKRKLGVRLLFDMRGFWAEERAESGSWNLASPVYRAVFNFFKRREAELLGEADHLVSLTRNAETEMSARPALKGRSDVISVIPCCVDFGHFALSSALLREKARQELGIREDRPVLAYLGSLGGNYMLDEMLDFFAAYRERQPGALFLFITRDDPSRIEAAAARKGLGRNDILIRPASREQVPLFLAAADTGIAFKQPGFSAKACSPTKLGEMLAVGLPVVANSGVGDVEEILDDTGSGVVVDRFDRATLEAAADRLGTIQAGPAQIRAGALRWFDLSDGVARYDRVYRAAGERTA
jgi:glycosyltransferase involved in cell wall biosynthesis